MSGVTGDVHPVAMRIAEARRDSGLTQRELATALRTSLHTVDRIEAGTLEPDPYLSTIAIVTGKDLEWFTPAPATVRRARTHPSAGQLMGVGSVGRNLVLGSIVALITVRFLTEVVPVLPRAANFIDIPILVTLAAASLFTPAVPAHRRRSYLIVGVPVFMFMSIATSSALVNSGRVAVAPVFVFIYGFLAPLGVYAAVYRLWPPRNAGALSRTIVALGLTQLVIVALIDIPQFATTRNPDDIGGTFGANAYQLVFFLLVFVTVLIGIAVFEPRRAIARFAPILIVASLAVILLAQYRALILAVVVAMLAVGVLLGGRVRGFVVVGSTALGLVVVFSVLAAQLPVLRLHSTASSIAHNPGSYASTRFGVAENVLRLYSDIPSAVVVGAGPGTYSSRAWQTFALATSTSNSNVAGGYAVALTGGKAYSTDVSERYVAPQLQHGVVVEGSRAVSSPYSSYTSLLAEVGVLGFALIGLIYFGALRRLWRMARVVLSALVPGDPLPAVVLGAFVAFLTLVQAALLENWFEVTRVTFVAWAMFAVASKELDLRQIN